ncbi:MAG: penicillin-binding protein [Alphaproteobacteria bacterium]|nr:MAG: penicillin-binding protein [Alphaproteobacteria bacterium]
MTKAKNKIAKKKKKGSKKKNLKRSLFFRFCKWMLVLGLWAGIFLSGVILWYAKDLPDITKSATFERRASIIIKAADGFTIARYGESKGKNIHVDEIPDYLIHAILATEDRRFYDHPGIDVLGITRAMMVNISKGRFVQGGSTITQQLAKNLFLTHDRKLARKIKEALLALWLERELSKNQILSAYMNRVYLGSGTYGVDAAAHLYFGKAAQDVNLREAAILAGLLKAPSRYSPHNSATRAKERSDVVIAAMKDAGYITQADMTEENLLLSLPHKTSKTGQNARYFTDWVIDGIDDLVGNPGMDMIIETTLDAGLQQRAYQSLTSAIDNAEELQFVSQGAVISLSPDGAILAMVGGYDYGQSQFNRTTQAKRAPGSAFKPFVYLSALEKGWKPSDEILDAPITTGTYRPKNFANKYYGTVTLETALAKSMNTATVRLAKKVGIGSILKTAKSLGFVSKMERDLSLTLGSSGISMLEMATGYAVLANGGYRIFPYAITRITNGEGRVLFNRAVPKSYQSIIRPKHVRAISSMMETVINEGTGRRARLPFPASGKTGTSQNSRDAWFVGYTGKVVSVVWLGNDDNSPMRRITGGGLPAEIWRDVMLYGNQNRAPITLLGAKGGGISELLGRLISNHTPIERKDGDYSNLND